MKGLSLTISKELASLRSILFQKGQTLDIGLLISDEMNNIKIQTIKKKLSMKKVGGVTRVCSFPNPTF